jgi:hypothetical protein
VSRIAFVLGVQRGVKSAPAVSLSTIYCGFLAYLRRLERADERSRTAFLLITSVRLCVAGTRTGLQIPHF